jgi:hypothetical protein
MFALVAEPPLEGLCNALHALSKAVRAATVNAARGGGDNFFHIKGLLNAMF